jgi:hypothetical protein
MCHCRIASCAVAAVVALGIAPVRAAEPAVVQLVGMFATLCLERFPDDAAVRQFATDHQFDVMPEERLRRLLGTDPGTGWLQNTARGQYVLTIEYPPYHTCAIRKADPVAPDFLPSFSQVLAGWAATQPGVSLKQLPLQERQIGGFPSQLHRWELDRGPDKRPEALMAIITNAAGMVEVRLARAIEER